MKCSMLNLGRIVSFLMALVLVAGMLALIPPIVAHAATLTVNDLGDAADANPGNGVCATAGGVCTLRAAIEEANANGTTDDTINFSVTGTINVSGSTLLISHNMTINGPGASQLSISGAGQQIFNVFTGVIFNLQSVTVANGGGFAGGGLYNNGTTTIGNSVFSNNSATNGSGAIYNSGALSISSSTFTDNSTTNISGGAIFSDGVLTVTMSTFTNNHADNGDGGAISDSGIMTVTHSTFMTNTANYGGAISTNSATTTATDCTFTSNSAISSGGAMSIYKGGVQVPQLTVSRSTFSGNSALYGGVIHNQNGILVTANTTFFSNTSSSPTTGGAVVRSLGTDAVTNMTHSTLSGNTGVSAIKVESDAILTLRNSIIANSTGKNCEGTITDGGGNLQYGGTTANSCGATIPTGDPALVALANNGGAVQTMALGTDSAAVNAAEPLVCFYSLGSPRYGAGGVDARGSARRGTFCDAGAFEAQIYRLYIGDGSGQSTQINTAFPKSLQAIARDSYSNELGGIGITFTGPAAGAGIVSGGSVTTNNQGQASLAVIANDTAGGPYNVVASTPKVGSINFSLTNFTLKNYYLPFTQK